MVCSNFVRTLLAPCLLVAGVLGLARAWAAPDAPCDAMATAPADAAQPFSGAGLMPAGTRVGGNAPALAAVSAPVVPNGSLLAVRPDVANPQHLDNALGEGIASWYGPRFQGRRTASGEKFDRYALTAAHKTLPLGSRVVVHNPRTGKRIVVRINDRGPYIRNRVLDLSEAAASALGLKARGHDWVVLRAAPPLDAPPGAMAQAIAPATRVHQPDTIARSIDDTAQAQAVSPPDAPNVAMLSTRLSATSIPDMATVPGTRPLSENGE